MVPIRYNVRSLFVRKATTIATATGIAMVVFVFAAAQMLGAGAQKAMVSSGRSDTVIVLRKGSDNELSSAMTDEYKKLGDRPGVAQVGGVGVVGEIVIVVTAELADNPAATSNVLVRGMPAEGYAFRPEIKLVSGRMPKPGTDEAIVGTAIAGRFKGIAMGDSFNLKKNGPIRIVGEFSAGGSSNESEVWGDRDVIRRYLGRDSIVSSARVRLSDASKFEAYRMSVEGDKSLVVKVQRETDYYEKQSQGTAGFLTIFGTIIAVLFAFAAMVGAAITMNGAVANRTREIGTLRALGFSRLSILFSFVLEAIALSLVGALIGLAFVMLLTTVTFRVMNFATFSDIVIKFVATPGMVLTSLIFSIVMGLLGGIFPAIRASRVSPVEAMRG